ncbi:MAG: hypothetical protein ACE5JI_20645 [Acidobacteriota bacterium]
MRRDSKPVSVATLAVVTASTVATLIILIYASKPVEGESRSWLGLIPFMVWALSPYPALAWLASRSFNSWVVLVGSLVVGGSALLLYYHGFVVEPDAQSGLLVVLLRLYQLFGCAIVWVVGAFLAPSR